MSILRMLLCTGALLFAAGASLARPIVTLTTDFGLENEAVGLVRGAILSVESEIEVVDLCHAVDSFDVLLGALTVAGTDIFPAGTVHVGVIDPGVGTPRAPIALRTRAGQLYVGPNNGLFTEVIRRQGLDAVVRIEPLRVNPRWERGTFDGRDLFGPAAAMLAVHRGDLARVGAPFPSDSLVLLPLRDPRVDATGRSVEGDVLRIDEPYGNIWTNVGRAELGAIGAVAGSLFEVVFTPTERASDPAADPVEITLPLVVTFGDVAEGEPLAYFASAGTLGFAINLGSFREAYGVAPGWRVRVSVSR